MRKKLVTIICTIMFIAMTFEITYAEGGITDKDIKEGLSFCNQYPVQLLLDGQKIITGAKDVPPVIVKERTLIPVRALVEAMGGQVSWDNEKQEVGIVVDGKIVTLTIGSNIAFVNSVAKQLDVPAMIIDHDGDYYGSTMIPVRFTAEGLGCMVPWDDPTRSVVIVRQKTVVSDPGTTANNETNEVTLPDVNTVIGQLPTMNGGARDKLIVIDLGHGGKDSGTIGHEHQADEVLEKDLNLKIGLILNELLQNAGAKTYMIRSTDIFYTLLERADFANSKGATFFVSIHNNSSEYSAPHGTEVHYNSKIDGLGQDEKTLYGIDSKSVAKSVQTEMVSSLGTFDRGIKNSPEYAVLNKTSMPAILVEGAFFSNENNFKLMNSEDYPRRYATAVAKGIIEQFNLVFSKEASSNSSTKPEWL